tara:strand:+ start:90920 stop:92557 length:1638 start_codon:yes stop_codon:yes gene_type:complete
MKAAKYLLPLTLFSCVEVAEHPMPLPGKYVNDVNSNSEIIGGQSTFEDETIPFYHIDEIQRVILPDEVKSQEAQCTSGMTQEKECETNNPCKGYQIRECIDEQWGKWSECMPWKQLTKYGSYRDPKVANGKITYLGINGKFNKDIYVDDLQTGESEQLIQQAAIVNIHDKYLSLVHAGQPDDCSIVDLLSKETIYGGLCASDIQGSTLVVSENKNDIIAFNFLTSETSEVAVNACHYHPKISGRNVVFYSKSENCNGNGRAHIWNLDSFDDQALEFDGQGSDKHVMIEGNSVIWSNYEGDKVRLLQYDIKNDKVSHIFSKESKSNACEEFTNYFGFMNQAGFNGKSLVYKTYSLFDCNEMDNGCKCSHKWDLRLYDLENNIEHLITEDVITGFKHKPLSRPSLDGKDLIFGKNEQIFHCELKHDYLKLPDLKIGELEALPNVFEKDKEVYIQFQIVNVSDVIVDEPFAVSIQACTPDAITCGQATSIELPGIGLETIIAGVHILPDKYVEDETYVKIIVDYENVVKEKDENNNEHGCEFYFQDYY